MAFPTLEERIVKCRRCRLWIGAMNAVPGEGSPEAKVMLIGLNPGKEEDKTGRSFMGVSGRFLNTILEKNGIKRDSIFITNIVKHRTPGNRLPFKDEISACRVYILEELRLLKPNIVVLMGLLARKEAPLMENIEYVRTFHPAAAMRFPKVREKFEADFRFLKRTIDLGNRSRAKSDRF